MIVMPSTKFFTKATCRGFNCLFPLTPLRFAISDLQGSINYDDARATLTVLVGFYACRRNGVSRYPWRAGSVVRWLLA